MDYPLLSLSDLWDLLHINDMGNLIIIGIGASMGFSVVKRLFGWAALQAALSFDDGSSEWVTEDVEPEPDRRPTHAQMAKRKMSRRKRALSIFVSCPKCGARRTSTPCEWCGTADL